MDQTEGQLMGSIVSFPFLCLANAALCRRAREKSTGRKMSLKAAQMAVNGDDCLFKSNLKGSRYWERMGELMGLKPSLGKVFESRRFCNMNSTRFVYHSGYSMESDEGVTEVPAQFEYRPYVNLGLVLGLKRSTKGGLDTARLADWSTISSFSENAGYMLETCPDQDRERVLGAFMRQNRDILSGTSLPWHIPEWLGGIGLPTLGKYRASEEDLSIARIVGSRFKLPSAGNGSSWKVWEYAQSRMPRKIPTMHYVTGELTTGPAESAQDQSIFDETTLMGRFCVEAIFRSRHVGRLFKEESKSNGVLGKVEEIWKKAAKLYRAGWKPQGRRLIAHANTDVRRMDADGNTIDVIALTEPVAMSIIRLEEEFPKRAQHKALQFLYRHPKNRFLVAPSHPLPLDGAHTHGIKSGRSPEGGD